MKIILTFALALTCAPLIASAQEIDYTSTFNILNSYSLWSAVVVALATSVMVFIIAKAMRGGLFGAALNYFGVGMILILGGFVAESISGEVAFGLAKTINNIFFILGYVVMAVAAHKLSKIAKGG